MRGTPEVCPLLRDKCQSGTYGIKASFDRLCRCFTSTPFHTQTPQPRPLGTAPVAEQDLFEVRAYRFLAYTLSIAGTRAAHSSPQSCQRIWRTPLVISSTHVYGSSSRDCQRVPIDKRLSSVQDGMPARTMRQHSCRLSVEARVAVAACKGTGWAKSYFCSTGAEKRAVLQRGVTPTFPHRRLWSRPGGVGGSSRRQETTQP